MKLRLVSLVVFAALAGALVAGCGGGSDSSSGKDPAEAAPPGTSVYVAGTVKPEGELADNVNSLAQKIAGVDDLGALIAEEIDNSSAGEGAEIDFEKEIVPLLGEQGGLFLQEYDGENFQGVGFAVQVEDEGGLEEVIEEKTEEGDEKLEDGSFEGVDFKVQEDESAFGFTEGLLIYAQNEKIFKQSVDALDGENLASQDTFTSASDEAPDGSLAQIYVDIGGLIEEAGQGIDEETQLGLDFLGIEPKGSTALISLVPGAEDIELDVSSNLSSTGVTGGDASDLLGSLPAGSIAAFSSAEVGKTLSELIDRIDANGIPGEVPPHQFKKALSQSGVDIESIVSSIGDIGFFLEGNSESNLGGALVIESKDSTEAQNTVKNLGLLLRASGTPGVTAITSGGLTGFSIRDDEVGPKPIVVAVSGEKIGIGYGTKSVTAALSGKAGTLADDPVFKEAQAALGDTPISGFLSGQSALTLLDAVASPLEQAELMEAKPYLEKVGYAAIGGSSSDEGATAKLVIGLAK